MKAWQGCTLSMLVLAGLLVGCRSKAGDTPRETLEVWAEAMAEDDAATLYALLPPSNVARDEGRWSEDRWKNKWVEEARREWDLDPDRYRSESLEDFFVAALEAGFAKAESRSPDRRREAKSAWGEAEVTDEKIDGDKATLTLKIGKRTTDLPLVREEGLWYIDYSPSYFLN